MVRGEGLLLLRSYSVFSILYGVKQHGCTLISSDETAGIWQDRLATVERWMQAPLMSEWRSGGAFHQLRRMDESLVEPIVSQVKSTRHIQLARIPVRQSSCWNLEIALYVKWNKILGHNYSDMSIKFLDVRPKQI